MNAERIKLTITDNTTGMSQELKFQDLSEFRMIVFPPNGPPTSIDRAPFKILQHPLKKYARLWAQQMGLQELAEIMKDTGCQGTAEEFIRAIEYFATDSGASVNIGCTNKNEKIAFRMLQEMLAALAEHWRRLISRPASTWEFSPDNSCRIEPQAILNWLFRR